MEDAQRPAAHVGASASLEKVLRSLHNTMPDDWREQYRSWLHRDSFAHPNTSAGGAPPGFRDLPDLPATHGHGSRTQLLQGDDISNGNGSYDERNLLSVSALKCKSYPRLNTREPLETGLETSSPETGLVHWFLTCATWQVTVRHDKNHPSQGAKTTV